MQTTKEMVAEVRRMAGEFVNDSVIAEKLNVDPRTVRNLRYKYNINSGYEAKKIELERKLLKAWDQTRDLKETVRIYGKSKHRTLDQLRRHHADGKVTLPEELLSGYYERTRGPKSDKNIMQARIDQSHDALKRLRWKVIKSPSLRRFLQTGEWPEMGNA